ncbi:PaaI family thioesterase [Tsukamurella soli]|uniref:Thioesterase domain-containing protein n=1 Tax=Tsukamurella soli TaxID=644556 RepID=A0ABP8JK97_9ACTN
MLDDTMSPATVSALGVTAPTVDLHVQFLRPAQPGRLIGRGRVVHEGHRIWFLAAELVDAAGRVVASGTATAMVRRAAQAA